MYLFYCFLLIFWIFVIFLIAVFEDKSPTVAPIAEDKPIKQSIGVNDAITGYLLYKHLTKKQDVSLKRNVPLKRR